MAPPVTGRPAVSSSLRLCTGGRLAQLRAPGSMVSGRLGDACDRRLGRSRFPRSGRPILMTVSTSDHRRTAGVRRWRHAHDVPEERENLDLRAAVAQALGGERRVDELTELKRPPMAPP